MIVSTTNAQTPLIPRLQLRNTFDESGKKPSAAQLLFTFPKGDKANSWLVDAGLAYTVKQTSTFTGKITTEFHKNNLVDKEQENLSGGFSGVWLQKNVKLQQLVTTGAKYVRDWQNQSHALAITGNYSFVKTTPVGLRLNAPGYLDKNRFTYLLTPYAGFEYQQIIQTKTGTQTGAILRGIINASAAFAINRRNTGPGLVAPHKFIEAVIDYTGRYAAVNKTGNGEDNTFMLKAGANLYLIDDNDTQVSVGAKLNNGSNPLQGLKNQRFWQLAINVQF
jgi:hypothetical protein